MAIDNIANASLPAPSEQEAYITGLDVNGLEIDMAALPAGMSMGVAAGNGPTQTTAPTYNDQAHPDGQTQINQMAGVTNGTPPNEILVNDSMYAVQTPLPLGIQDTAQPLLTGNNED